MQSEGEREKKGDGVETLFFYCNHVDGDDDADGQ